MSIFSGLSSLPIVGSLAGGGGSTAAAPAQAPNAQFPINTAPAPVTGVPSQFTPGNSGAGSIPAYVGGMYPGTQTGNYSNVNAAPYNFTSPQQYAKGYAPSVTSLFNNNYQNSENLGLGSLRTELTGLSGYSQGAAALKAGLTAQDNSTNQASRTSQVNSVLPNAAGDLAGQRSDALAYASGSLPSAANDKALELNIRSSSADQSSSGGFGASSSAAQKASTLMSAQTRLGLSEYGNQLLDQNISTSSGLFLAPTEYNNSGGQVNVNPSESTTQIAGAESGQLNSLNQLPTTSALASQTQQGQFQTSLTQQTGEFNASNNLQLGEFNASTVNAANQNLFSYNVGYAGAVAGGQQTGTNTGIEVQEQQQAWQIQQQYLQEAQTNANVNSIFSGLGSFGTFLGGSGGKGGGGGFGGFLGSLGGMMGGGTGGAGTTGGDVGGDMGLVSDAGYGEDIASYY